MDAESPKPPGPSGASLQVPAGHGQLAEERRQVTVLYADLVGSTVIAARLDPEELRQLLGSFFSAIARQVARYDGTLDKYVGDAVMAVFGAPVSHENDAARALHAALAIRDAVGELNAELARQQGARLAIRMGVNTGEVVSGILARDVQSSYTIVGEAVHLAQRLQAAAQPGEILVGAVTQRLARGFEFEPPRQIKVKDRVEPVTVYRLLGGPGPDTVAPQKPATELVGRSAELRRVADAVDALSAGTGGLIAIVGEAGVGKSRLVAEVRRSPGAARWLEGHAVSIGRTISYLPFLEMIRTDAGITDRDGESESWSKIQQRVRALFGEDVDAILPYLARLLGLEVPGELGERVSRLEADAIRRQIFLVSRRYFTALAAEAPLVLLFEDLHWADDSSVALLEHIVPLTASSGIAICVTTRPDAADRLARLRTIATASAHARLVEVPLTPLGSDDSSRLVAALLGTDAAPPGLREVVLAKTEGNPFFIEELIRSLVELGVITHDRAEGWALARPLENVSIPDSVQGVIRARIDRLDDELKRVIRVASVIGRSFFYRVLRSVTETDHELDRELGALQGLEIILERARLPELEYSFRHVLIQESTYDSILVRHRHELHHLVATTIESLFANRLEDFYGVLAYHFARAEDWTKAQEYLFRAADQAGRVAADAEAIALYDEAIAAYGRAFGDRWDPIERGRLESKIGEALFRVGEHGKGLGHLHRALAHFGQPFPETKGRVRLALLRELGRQLGHRLTPALAAEPDATAVDAVAELRLHAYEVLAWIDYYLDNERLLLDSIRLLNESEKRGWPLGIVIGSLGMGIVCDFIPAFGIAERYHRRGLALAEATQLPQALGHAFIGLGYHQQRTGEWAAALENWGHGAEHFRKAGDLAKWGAATWGTTWIAHRTGQLERSRRQSEELIRVGRDTADRQLWGWGLYFLGRWLWQSGDLDAGIRSLEQAIALFREIPDLPNLAGASGDLGMCRLRQGRWAEAVDILEGTAQLMREQDVRGFLAHVHNALAEAYLSQAEGSTGSDRTIALAHAAKATRSAMKRSKVEREGFVAAYRVRGTYEWLTGNTERARVAWQTSLERAEALGARYDGATTELEFGRRTQEAGHLERAATTFAELRATLDLARARELLATLGQRATDGPRG